MKRGSLRCVIRYSISLVGLLLLAGCAAPHQAVVPDDVLRLHVVANSDSAEDQAAKISVRDAVLQIVEPQPSATATRAYLLSHGKEILSAARQTLQEQGFSYDVQLMLGTFDFPDRSYGDRFFPAGRYEALRVVLGSGAGENWWCVLFPPLCIVSETAEPLSDGDTIVFHSSIWDFIQRRREK